MKTVNSALLSFGMSGQVFHAPFLTLHPGFNLLGSWERSSKKIEEKYPGTRSYNSLEEVLEDDSVELVVVNTPTLTHYDYAKRALQAGKHVVVEKAFTGTAAEAVELRDLAAAKDLTINVYQNRRWDSDFLTVKKVLDEGMIGDLVEASFGFLRYNPELSPKTHKEIPSSGAGIIKDLGAHVLDQALFQFGMPQSVFADIAQTRPESQVDDYFDILLKYEAFRVHVKGGYFYRESGPSYILHGTKGSFLKSRGDVQEDQLKAGMTPDNPEYGVEPDSEKGLLHTEMGGEVIRDSIPTLSGDYKQYYEAVYQSIANGKKPAVSAQDGVNSMTIIEAAFESAAQKRVIEI